MKTLPIAVRTVVLVLLGMLASGAAMAQHRGHGYGHGYGHGSSHRGNVHFGISLGVPLFAAAYYPVRHYVYPAYVYPAPVYRYPAPVVVSTSPPVYVERDAAQAAGAATQVQGDWYYCTASRSYYPYVAECPAGWQRVPAQPQIR